MAEVKLDDATMRDIVTAAIVKSMTEETRAVLVQNAVKSLLEPVKRDNYSSAPPKTRLQEIFEDAVYRIANDEVKSLLASDPKVKTMLADIVSRGLEKCIADDQLVANFAAGMSGFFAKAASRY